MRLAARGWTNKNVTLHCTTTGASRWPTHRSPRSTSTSVPIGTSNANASTGSQEVCDVWDQCTTSGPFTGIAVDQAAPTVSFSSPVNGQVVVAGRATAGFTCADADSGIASCTGSTAAGAALPTAPGPQTLSVTATDDVGNTTSASAHYTVVAAVTGKVVDASSLVGLGGVNVRFYPHGSSTMTASTVTAPDGTFSENVLPAGTYDVAFAKSGSDQTRWLPAGASQSQAVPITIGANAAVVNGSIMPLGDLELAGTVTAAENGTPLAGATVNLLSPGAINPIASTTTASDGTYLVPARPSGSYEVQVQAANRVDRWYPDAEVRAADTTLSLTTTRTTATFGAPLAIAPLDTIIGTITDAVTGQPVSAVNVRLWAFAGKSPLLTTTTAADGSYSLDGVAPGTYQIQFAKSGAYQTTWWRYATVQSASEPIVFDGVATRADATVLPVGRTEIGGVVRSTTTATPIGDATVTVYLHGSTTATASITTGNDGHYSLLVPAGTYDLVASAPGYLATWWSNATTQSNATPLVATNATPANLALPTDPNVPESIYGNVTDAATGKPVAGVNVRLWANGTQTFIASTTDANGNYQILGVTPGKYQMQFTKSGNYQTTWWTGATVHGQATTITDTGPAIIINAALTHI